MRVCHTLCLALLFVGSASQAQAPSTSASADCGLARDPARCEARQAALIACSHERGQRKTDCIADRMPPIDCSKTANPARCEATEHAKQLCADKTGKGQTACLKGEKQKNKTKKANKTSKKKKAAKKAVA